MPLSTALLRQRLASPTPAQRPLSTVGPLSAVRPRGRKNETIAPTAAAAPFSRRRSTARALAPPAASLDELEPEAECSRAVYEAVVLHLLQQDCDVQLQRALNKEDFELAQALRAQRTRVDEALDKLKAFRAAAAAGEDEVGVGGANPSSSSSSTTTSSADSIDEGLAALRLRSELAVAVEAEDYTTASRLRDELKELEARSASAANSAARAAEFAAAARPPAFRLGQRITHVRLGYRGAIAGWDEACMESPAWRRNAGITAEEEAGRFYHVLIDVRDWNDGEDGPPPVAYVPESRLAAPEEEDDPGAKTAPASDFEHPFSYLLFLGPDARGDLIPSRALRERFGVERRDVGPPA